MRVTPLLVSLVLLGTLACSTVPTRGQFVMRDVSFPLRDMKLPSGMRVIVEEDPRSPMVAVVSLVGSGSANNPAGKEGIAHFVEHLTFRSRPDSKTSLWTRLERAGAGSVNAFTSLDYTLYYAAAPKASLAELLRIEGQRLRTPLAGLDPKVFEVEREVVRNELRERNETGYVGQVFTWLQQASFPAGHPYARPAIGTHESLSAITLNDARSFVRQHYRPDNITLVIVGDVDLATIDQLITEHLPPALVGEGLPLAPDPRMSAEPAKPPLSPKGSSMAQHEAALPTPELYISWVLPRGFDAASSVQDFVRISLQRQLWAAMSVDGDIAGLQTDLIPGREASLLVCRVLLRQGDHPSKSAEVVLDQLFRLWDAPSGDFTEQVEQREIFGQMRLAAISDMALEAENLVDRAVRRAELTHFNLDARAYSRSLQAMAQLGASSVTDFAYKYLTRERARVVYVRPPSTTVASTNTGPVGIALSGSEEVAEQPAAPKPVVLIPGVANYRTVRLENGLEVIIGNRPGMPLVTVGLALHGGSAGAHPRGVAELADMLSYPETDRQGSPKDFGFRVRSGVERDHARYVLSGAAGNVGNMLAILAERMSSMRTSDYLVHYYAEQVLPYIRSVEDWPEVAAERDFRQALYGEHPYGQTATANDLASVTEGAVNTWLRQTHQPSNAIVAIVGELDVDAVEKLAREWLGGWRASGQGASFRAAPLPPARGTAGAGKPRVLITERPGATQAQIELGCLLPEADEAAATRYTLLAELAGNRLTQVLRHELGASYGFHGATEVLRGGASHLVLRGRVDNAHLPQALATLTRNVTEFSQGTFQPGELERMQRQLLARYSVSHGTSSQLVSAVLDARLLGWPLSAVDAAPTHLAAATEQLVSQDFSACTSGKLVLSVLGDPAVVREAVQGLASK
jgi:zinc protease